MPKTMRHLIQITTPFPPPRFEIMHLVPKTQTFVLMTFNLSSLPIFLDFQVPLGTQLILQCHRLAFLLGFKFPAQLIIKVPIM